MSSKTSVVTVAGAGVAAVWLGYNCFAPTSQLYGRTITHCPARDQIALTFDDGPNEPYTRELLEILAERGAKATFFLIGRFVAARPWLAREIVEAGHSIGNHSFNHRNLLLLSQESIRRELEDCSQAIFDETGIMPRFFRPPWGARRPAVLTTARDLGLTPVMWSVTCYDWKRTTPERVFRHAQEGIEKSTARGPIVLLHDGGHTDIGVDRSHTLAATRQLLAYYRDRHFRSLDQILS